MLDDDHGGPLAEVEAPGDDSQATISPWLVLGVILILVAAAAILSMMVG